LERGNPIPNSRSEPAPRRDENESDTDTDNDTDKIYRSLGGRGTPEEKWRPILGWERTKQGAVGAGDERDKQSIVK
jgi:hypothetical protein